MKYSIWSLCLLDIHSLKNEIVSDLATRYILDKNFSSNFILFASLINTFVLIVSNIIIHQCQKMRKIFTISKW